MIELGTYCMVVGVAVVLYALGITLHDEVKDTFKEIKDKMINASSNSAIKKNLQISYPCFLAHNRAHKVHWVVNGLYSIVTLIVLILWFGVTIFNAVEKGIKFSDSINIIDTFGAFGIVQPVIVYFAIIILILYWKEARAFKRWRQ